jgi:hypothetical protein
MLRADHLITGLGALVFLGWIAARALPSVEEGDAPAAGRLAPVDASRARPWEELARIPAAHLGRGGVIAMDARDDTLFLLWGSSWLWVHRDSVRGPFGSRVSGDPTSLGAGIGIVARRDHVLILDGARQVLSRWSLDGTRGPETDLRGPDGQALHHLALGDAGSAAVVVASLAVADTTLAWHLVRHADPGGAARADTLRQQLGRGVPFAAYDVPWFATHGDTLTAIFSHSARLLSLDAAGRTRRDVQRVDQPRWPTADSTRRAMARWASLVTPATLRLLALPPLMPSLRGLTIAPTGERLVLTAAGDRALHAELLDSEGRAVARLWAEAESAPVHAVRGALFRLRDLDAVLVVERQRVRGRP